MPNVPLTVEELDDLTDALETFYNDYEVGVPFQVDCGLVERVRSLQNKLMEEYNNARK